MLKAIPATIFPSFFLGYFAFTHWTAVAAYVFFLIVGGFLSARWLKAKPQPNQNLNDELRVWYFHPSSADHLETVYSVILSCARQSGLKLKLLVTDTNVQHLKKIGEVLPPTERLAVLDVTQPFPFQHKFKIVVQGRVPNIDRDELRQRLQAVIVDSEDVLNEEDFLPSGPPSVRKQEQVGHRDSAITRQREFSFD